MGRNQLASRPAGIAGGVGLSVLNTGPGLHSQVVYLVVDASSTDLSSLVARQPLVDVAGTTLSHLQRRPWGLGRRPLASHFEGAVRTSTTLSGDSGFSLTLPRIREFGDATVTLDKDNRLAGRQVPS